MSLRGVAPRATTKQPPVVRYSQLTGFSTNEGIVSHGATATLWEERPRNDIVLVEGEGTCIL